MDTPEQNKLLEHIIDTYGDLTSIDDVQMKDGKFYITATAEKNKVIFVTGGSGDEYRYSPDSLHWINHIYAGIEILPRLPEIITIKHIGHTSKSRQMKNKYGKIKSMKIIHHWKYFVDGQIFVKKRIEPLDIRLSTCYNEFLSINTFNLSWDELYPNDQIPHVYESD